MSQNLVTVEGLKMNLFKEQQKNLASFLGDEQKANKFLGAVAYCFQSVPKLAECTQESIVTSFMKCAELNIFPSSVSGEAYVLPYKGKAQFQLGYQGLVTLFYRAGAKSIRAEIVYKNDPFSYENGILRHTPDIFAEDRGEAIGAYVIVELQTGALIPKVMSKKKILEIGKKFSQSYGTEFTPWNEKNDPELWMWKKTCLKQVSKLVPKNEALIKAIDYDNTEDTDFEEIKKNKLLEQANRASEGDVSKLLGVGATTEENSSITDAP